MESRSSPSPPRPLHTNAVIFAFRRQHDVRRNLLLTQRLCKVRTASIFSPASISGAGSSSSSPPFSPFPPASPAARNTRNSSGPHHIAVVLIWVVFAVNFFWTLAKRNEPRPLRRPLVYIATIVTVAMLYIVNHLSLPPRSPTLSDLRRTPGTVWCNGGTATTPSPSSSPRRSSHHVLFPAEGR